MPDLTALADASNAFDAIVHALIIDELSPVLDRLTEDEERAAETVREAIAAMARPQAYISELESQLAEMRSKAEDFRARIGNPLLSAEDRVQARLMVPFYEQESEALRQKLEQANADLAVYQASVNAARRELETVQRAKVNAAEGMLDPFKTPFGQATQAYGYHLDAHLTEIILNAGETDPRWDSAIALLEKLCLASGFRTDDLNRRESEMAKRTWDDYRSEQLSKVPTPAGQDVMSATNAVMSRIAQDKNHHDVIDDRRGLKLIRNDSVRDELRWSR